MRKTITKRDEIEDLQKNQINENDDEKHYKGLVMRLRKRIYSSLHSMPNFKALNSEALAFVFYQVRSDYTNFEILKRPNLSVDNA